MTKPQQFILTTDFDAMKNDDTATVVLNIPSGTVIAGGASYTPASSSVTVGQRNATIRARCSSSKYPGRWVIGTSLITPVAISASFGTYDENVTVYLERISATAVRAWCDIHNFDTNSITITESQTITFEVRTFVSPFEEAT